MKRIYKILPQIIAVTVLIVLWQAAYSLKVFPELIFPSIPDIFMALFDGIRDDNMGLSILYSLYSILKGILVGVVFAMFFSALAMLNGSIRKIYNLFISVFDPLPGIALLPLAILWFGTGENTVVFIIVHSVVWPLSRSILDGFSAVPKMYIETGKNYGLKGFQLVKDIYFFAALPSILSGLKTGWARAWRALISAEMIFGVAGSVGGIGWYIFTSRYKLDTPSVYASLVAIIIIGLVVEYGIFYTIEKKTVLKWGGIH